MWCLAFPCFWLKQCNFESTWVHLLAFPATYVILYTQVVDAEGDPLPGALVSLSGTNFRSNSLTNSNGELTFADLVWCTGTHTCAMYACTDVENAVPVCLNCNRHKASITFGHFTVSMTLSLPQRMSLSQMEAQKRFSLWDTGLHSGT